MHNVLIMNIYLHSYVFYAYTYVAMCERENVTVLLGKAESKRKLEPGKPLI